LAPDHEQAWLWLSGVEDSDPRKIAALNEVLRINPANAAAWRGLELLNQPKSVDLSELAPLPPRRAPEPPAPAPALAAPPPPPAKKIETGNLAAAPASQEAPDLFAELRPAIAKASSGKRQFWLRPSEMVLLAVLVPILFGGMTFFNNQLAKSVGDNPPAGTAAGQAQPTEAPALDITIEPAAAAPDATPAAPAADMIRSQSYGLEVLSVDVDENNQWLTVHLKLTNLTARQTRYLAGDFALTNGRHQLLQVDPELSSLISGQSSVVFVIDPGQPRTGSIRVSGDVSALPIVLTWRPTNGNTRKEITVR
ncbi:MAG TPA: hypothetical protein VGE07_06650, partial [Herpetosiphonaceae bacterium]